MVEVQHLSKTFGTDTEVLKDINLHVKKNEVVEIGRASCRERV